MIERETFHFRCAGSSLMKIPPCGWSGTFTRSRWPTLEEIHATPDRCPKCSNSIVCYEVTRVPVKQTFLMRCIGSSGNDKKPCGWSGWWSRILPASLDEEVEEPSPDCPECGYDAFCCDLISEELAA